MNTLGKQLSAYSLVVIALIMVAGLIQGKKLLVMFNIGVSWHYIYFEPVLRCVTFWYGSGRADTYF
jgi:hypothetical protein